MRTLLAVLAALLVLAAPATAKTPPYKVGAATRDITPVGPVNLGGFGLGAGPRAATPARGRGGVGETKGERIPARAIVFDDGKKAIPLADIETQGMFAAYE